MARDEYDFRWNEWNVDHIGEHGVSPEDAEHVVKHARRPYPRQVGDEKILVRGQNASGDHLQVIYLLDDAWTVYVIHARPLTASEKSKYRRHFRR